MQHLAEVSANRQDGYLEWRVALDGQLVATFILVTEALDYASLLECDPRTRKEAVANLETIAAGQETAA